MLVCVCQVFTRTNLCFLFLYKTNNDNNNNREKGAVIYKTQGP